eukprot:11221482-Ditylum_brightwellii.AAC.1
MKKQGEQHRWRWSRSTTKLSTGSTIKSVANCIGVVEYVKMAPFYFNEIGQKQSLSKGEYNDDAASDLDGKTT